MKRKNFKLKFISICLSLLFLLQLTPAGVFSVNSMVDISETASSKNLSMETINITEGNMLSEKLIVQEDVSKRDEFVKHFYCSDGTFVAIYYPEAVHYEKNGVWYDVDNTLSLDSKTGRYRTANSDFTASFASTNSGNLVTLEKDGNVISWDLHISKANKSKSSATSNLINAQGSYSKALSSNTFSVNLQESVKSVDFEGMTPETLQTTKLPNLKGKIEYNNVFEGNSEIDVHYTVEQNKIKEDIILKEKTDVTSYIISIEIGNLTAILNNDNSVSLDDKSGKTVYIVEAPYMYDAMDDLSYDFEVQVTQKGSSCIISYTPADEWLNSEDRVYPVVIDPTIKSSEYDAGIVDTFVREGTTTNYSSNIKLYTGKYSGKINRSYIKFTTLPTIDESMPITKATLSFSMPTGTTTGGTFLLQKVLSSWEPETITFASQPTVVNRTSIPFTAGQYVYTYDITADYTNSNVSDITNGFCFRYSDETVNDYNTFWSSDYGTVADRPTLKVEYGFSMPSTLTEGAVYTFVNYITEKAMTVHNGLNVNDTNVYQQTRTDETKQLFKLERVSSTGGYLLRAMCSSNGNGKVLDIYKENGYVKDGCNVQIYDNVDSIAQEWFIIPVASTRFRIVPRTNMSLCLAVCGSANGTATGKTSTDEGNVFVQTYTSLVRQTWEIWEGDTRVTNTANVSALESYTVVRGQTSSIQFTCDLNSGDTVEWSTSNPYVVTINSNGLATVQDAGSARITATITRSDSTTKSEICTVHVLLPDGVYHFNNVQNNYKLDIRGGSAAENASIIAYSTSTAEPTQRNRMFKIVHLREGKYIIRSMLKSDMGLTVSGDNVVVKTIGASDYDIPNNSLWRIFKDENGHYLQNYAYPSKCITCPADPSADFNISLSPYSSSNNLQNWTIRAVSTQYNGVGIYDAVSSLNLEDEHQFLAGAYSSSPDYNGGGSISWSVTNGDGEATISNTGVLSPVKTGNVTVTVTYTRDSATKWSCSQNVKIYKKAIIILPGIMGSEIYADGELSTKPGALLDDVIPNNTLLWPPSLIDNDDRLLALECDSNGEPYHSTKVKPPRINIDVDQAGENFGATDIYRELYKKMYNDFFDQGYDIVLYEYDWRKNPYDVALELDDFISDKVYDEIVFVSHSMGGLVSSQYLAQGNEQRLTVDKHISIGTPYLGSVKLPYVYVTGEPLGSFADNFLSDNIPDVIYNFPSTYSLMPYEQKFEWYLSYDELSANNTKITVNCYTYEDTMNILSSYMKNWNNDLMDYAKEKNALLFTNNVHITASVDSYYIIGDDVDDTIIKIKGVPNNRVNPLYFETVKINENVSEEDTDNGDGTVTIYSATIGGTSSQTKTFCKSDSNTKDASHTGMIDGSNETSTLDFISRIINGSWSSLTSADLLSNYGMTQ